MNYDNFEDHIHALILQRGREYFDGGHVKEVENTADGWVLEVRGQSTYRVVLKGEETLEDWYCDCPHEHGPVCKHVAAALYAVRAHTNDRLDNLLGNLSAEELRNIIREQIRQAPHLLQSLEDRYAEVHLFDDEEE